MTPHISATRASLTSESLNEDSENNILDLGFFSPEETSQSPIESDSQSIDSSESILPSELPTSPTRTATDELSGLSDDEYITSDDEILTTVVSLDEQRHHFAYGSTFAEHTDYFSKSLSHALDSVKLDKSLVAQAQLSGYLNNKSQKLAEKHLELIERITSLRSLYRNHVLSNRMGDLEKDLAELNTRIENIKNGMAKTLLFGRKGTVGVAEKYPVEYNQAKDKVLERVSEN
ncbi:CIC11C00000001187 [Sungouiella intermedia]|uniref:Biogenesis of lysosome-related organelles complex 1 subunit KXD1 n=1 Tax=Sungouiella intermedia TaxID=45354 RepID=A0A1L0C1Y1_9ASCO|nr:CIC11C00000001187 [[Candida] intermedia]